MNDKVTYGYIILSHDSSEDNPLDYGNYDFVSFEEALSRAKEVANDMVEAGTLDSVEGAMIVFSYEEGKYPAKVGGQE